MTNNIEEQLRLDARRVSARHAARSIPSPPTLEVPALAPRLRLRVAVASIAAVAILVTVIAVVRNRDREAIAPAAPTPSVYGGQELPAVPTEPTTATTSSATLDSVRPNNVIPLPPGWTYQSDSSLPIPAGLGGVDGSVQTWGVPDPDGVSLVKSFRVIEMPTPDQANSELKWADDGITGRWIQDGTTYTVVYGGMTQQDAAVLLSTLTPRTAGEPLAGFSSSSDLTLVEDYRGTGAATPAGRILTITVVDTAGIASEVQVTRRLGPAYGSGAPLARVRIDEEHVAERTPDGFPVKALDWSSDGIQFKVLSGSSFDDALLLARAVARVSDQTWSEILGEIGDVGR